MSVHRCIATRKRREGGYRVGESDPTETGMVATRSHARMYKVSKLMQVQLRPQLSCHVFMSQTIDRSVCVDVKRNFLSSCRCN